MKEKTRKKLITIVIFLIILIALIYVVVLPNFTEARSGCCSWHGGVCTYQCSDGVNVGYKCCDGTSLSAKCAPYYSRCPIYNPEPKSEPKSEPKPEPKSETSSIEDLSQPEADSEISPQNSYTAAVQSESKETSYAWIWWVMGIIIVGIIAYGYSKTKKRE
jgi:hypothetical protein